MAGKTVFKEAEESGTGYKDERNLSSAEIDIQDS